MNCLFCKQDSSNSRSVEHIIPESLGNKDYVLPRGIVCDDCNNYFAVKIEKPLLEQLYFQSLRSRNDLLNKKGRYVPEHGMIFHPQGGPIDIYQGPEGFSLSIEDPKLVKLVQSLKSGSFLIPIYTEPEADNLVLSRFICKVALEALTLQFMPLEEWESETIYKEALDPIRSYVRYGNSKIGIWPYHQKRIYSEEDRFIDANEKLSPYECLHEWQLYYSEHNELFFIMCIMGVEYAINYARPEIESFALEIKKNGGKSLLFRDHQKIVRGSKK